MADKHQIATLSTSAAQRMEVSAVLHLDVKMTRGYIWLFKLKYIWAVIRAKVGE